MTFHKSLTISFISFFAHVLASSSFSFSSPLPFFQTYIDEVFFSGIFIIMFASLPNGFTYLCDLAGQQMMNRLKEVVRKQQVRRQCLVQQQVLNSRRVAVLKKGNAVVKRDGVNIKVASLR